MALLSTLHKALSPVYAELKTIHQLAPSTKEAMHGLMTQYYDELCQEKFYEDLSAKNKVILLRDRKDERLVGFSTLYIFSQEDIAGLEGSRPFTGVFSGDTIIARDYWGGSALQIAFGVYLSYLKLRRPWQPVYWFLISKGYKTYLLMGNNFPQHYPRYEAETPAVAQTLMNKVYRQLFPQRWHQKSGLIFNHGGDYHLKLGLAAPDRKLCEGNARVAYFVRRNQNWQAGDELACLAEMNLSVLTDYLKKRLAKNLAKLGLKGSSKEVGYASH